MLVDTHCHIHSKDYQLDGDEVIKAAKEADVTKLICVGTDVDDSRRATVFAGSRDSCWASIGLHPHDAKLGHDTYQKLSSLITKDVVAIGECGLDYFYNHSEINDQQDALHFQLDLAKKNSLPVIFHVREAFDDFWSIYDQYNLPGVIHSFTAGHKELEGVLSRNLVVGLNGIVTFTKDQKQLDAIKAIPLQNLVLETDAPFLTPVPKRGTVNQSKYIVEIAKFLSDLRDESFEELASVSTINAEKLFNI